MHPGKERFRANSAEQVSLLLGLDECIHQVAKVEEVILDRKMFKDTEL